MKVMDENCYEAF